MHHVASGDSVAVWQQPKGFSDSAKRETGVNPVRSRHCIREILRPGCRALAKRSKRSKGSAFCKWLRNFIMRGHYATGKLGRRPAQPVSQETCLLCAMEYFTNYSRVIRKIEWILRTTGNWSADGLVSYGCFIRNSGTVRKNPACQEFRNCQKESCLSGIVRILFRSFQTETAYYETVRFSSSFYPV